jgi:hypothetical protein
MLMIVYLSLYVEGACSCKLYFIEYSYELFHQICLLCSLFYSSSCLNGLLILRIKIFL